MRESTAEIIDVVLPKGKGDYYNNLMDFYFENKLEDKDSESQFEYEIMKLLADDEIKFNDKLSILNCLVNIIDRDGIWKLVRLRRDIK